MYMRRKKKEGDTGKRGIYQEEREILGREEYTKKRGRY
tara:strand:+ start:138 stop:251 length:114 start_codon:yes stop_codon:yes gene_type:complete